MHFDWSKIFAMMWWCRWMIAKHHFGTALHCKGTHVHGATTTTINHWLSSFEQSVANHQWLTMMTMTMVTMSLSFSLSHFVLIKHRLQPTDLPTIRHPRLQVPSLALKVWSEQSLFQIQESCFALQLLFFGFLCCFVSLFLFVLLCLNQTQTATNRHAHNQAFKTAGAISGVEGVAWVVVF